MPSDAFKSWGTKFGETGDVCPFALRCTRERIRATFGEPDEMGSDFQKHKTPSIWIHGELEFDFRHKSVGALSLI